jgi:two-component system cell cycle response regulator DivK
MVDDFTRTKTILVVEPSQEIREGLTSLLNGYGYRVKEALDADGGVASFKEGDVDLVLMEMSPQRSVREELMALRSPPGGEEVPVVALVKTEDVGGVAAWLDAGCDDFLLKPVSPRLLFQRIQTLLESNPRAYNRVECNVVAELTTGTQHEAGTFREVGEGGAGMVIEEQLPPGDIVKVNFPLPGHREELVVGAEVIYVQEIEGQQYLHGLRFIIIDTGTREKIRQYVEEVLHAKS